MTTAELAARLAARAAAADRAGALPTADVADLRSSGYLRMASPAAHAVAARDALVAYARERVPSALGHPIAELPALRRGVGELQVALHVARATLHDAASAWDARRDGADADAEVAKVACVDAATRITAGALRLAGGAGLGSGLALERHFRDARAGYAHPPGADAVYARQAAQLLDVADAPVG